MPLAFTVEEIDQMIDLLAHGQKTFLCHAYETLPSYTRDVDGLEPRQIQTLEAWGVKQGILRDRRDHQGQCGIPTAFLFVSDEAWPGSRCSAWRKQRIDLILAYRTHIEQEQSK